jgi:DNA-binding CsgD family transcriptional regulator
MLWPVGLQALADFRLGEWARAWAGALEAERLALETGLDIDVANNRQLLALIAAARGNRDDCLRYADLVLRQTRPAGAVVFDLLISGTLGLLELGSGQPDRAIEPLERARALAARTGLREAGHFHWAADLVDAYVRCGRRDAALPLVRELEDQAERTRRPIIAALAARCRGTLQPDGDHYDRALAWHALTSRPFETAQTRLAYGQSLRRRRRRADARVHLRAAWEIFGSLGATGWTEQARRELEAAGVTVGARPLTGADLLTPQELRVALEVAEGASNRQVAERLFLSAKTVEYHLSHVYQKLSIASRTELGATLRASRSR